MGRENRRLGLTTIGVVCAVAATLMLWSGSASAALTHEFVSSFGSFSGSLGVAVEQFSGDVYVVDSGANTVDKFDASGTPVLGWSLGAMTGPSASGLSSPYGVAVDQTSGDLYVADFNNGAVDKFDSNGNFLLSFTGSATPAGFFNPAGLATDSAGDVYVADPSNGVVDKSDSSGAYLASFSGEGHLSGTNGVAVDASGNVYATANYQLIELDSTGACVNSCTPIDEGGSVGVGIDPNTGHVYAADGGQISEFDTARKLVDQFGSGSFGYALGVAVDGASGQVYTSDLYGVVADVFGPLVTIPDASTESATGLTTSGATLRGVVNPDGVEVSECEFEYGTDQSYGHTVQCETSPGSGSEPVEVKASITGLSPNTGYHYRLVAANVDGASHGQDVEFTTLSSPIIGHVSALKVTATTATFSAIVTPVGFDTTYHFEYDTSEYASAASHGTSVPVPDADMGAAIAVVSQSVSGLQPGTKYHYRVVATNANGTTYGGDRSFTTIVYPPPAQADTCPNARYREGRVSERLPECRAYEMVTPVDKNGSDIEGTSTTNWVAVDGERIVYAARSGFGETSGSGVAGGTDYVATRGEAGWRSRGVTPTPSIEAAQLVAGATAVYGFSEELDRAILSANELPHAQVGVVKGENLYREDTLDGELDTLTVSLAAPVTQPSGFEDALAAHSGDMGVVTFEAPFDMLPETEGLPETEKLYAWEEGTLKLAGILPDGTIPATGSRSPQGGCLYHCEELRRADTVSRDGSHILFVATPEGGSAPQLYMRESGTRTVWVSQSETASPSPEPANVVFETASPDLKNVLFMSTDRLTDSDPGGAKYGLYLYKDGPNPATEPNLTFIARIDPAIAGEPSTVVNGMSDDGSHIYFSSYETGELRQGRSVYLWDKGAVHMVVPHWIGRDEPVFQQEERVSADGRVFAFTIPVELGVGDTGSWLGVGGGPGTFNAMYVYSEATDSLRCVSCPSNGAAMTSDVEINPKATHDSIGIGPPTYPHFLTSDGRYVFFSMADALVPQDTNGLYDVYGYDTETGRLALLSPGDGDNGSWFVDSAMNGRDVFIDTREALTGWDVDNLVDIYDARVGGGLPEPPPLAVPCVGDECQGIPSAAPTFNTASGFSGLGNPVPVQTVKQKQKIKKAHRAHKRVHKRVRHKKRRSSRGRRYGVRERG